MLCYLKHFKYSSDMVGCELEQFVIGFLAFTCLLCPSDEHIKLLDTFLDKSDLF